MNTQVEKIEHADIFPTLKTYKVKCIEEAENGKLAVFFKGAT